MLSRRIPPLDEINPWTRALEARRAAGASVLDLTSTDPARAGLAGAGPEALAALAAAAGAPYAPDPRGARVAREAVAAHHRARGATLASDDVVLTTGTSESCAHLFRLLGDPGDVFLIPSPGYPLFEPIAAAEGVEVRAYPLACDGAWRLDLDAFARAAAGPRVRAALLVQPHHPTGSALDPDAIAAVEDVCAARGIAIVADEVFADFAWPGAGGGVTSLLAGERRVPTFVLAGLSKSCGMPELKLGWIALAGPAPARSRARAGLEWLADLFLSVAQPVQCALPRLLEAGEGQRARVRERLAGNLARLRAFTDGRCDVALAGGGAGWAAILRLPRDRSDEAWALELLARGVAVHPGHFFDLEDGPYVVLGLLAPPDVLEAALGRLAAALEAA